MDLDLLAPRRVFSAERARALGLSRTELRRHLREGTVVRLHRGWYPVGPVESDLHRHRLRVEALLQEYAGTALATGVSALVRLGLPTYRPDLDRAQLILLDPAMHRHRKPDLVVAAAAVEAAGLAPTALGTVHPAMALAETGLAGQREFLVPADAALRRRLVTPADLEAAVDMRTNRRGIAALRTAVGWCDARHESPGETLTGYVLRMLGHDLEPQFSVPGSGQWTPGGHGYRADFRIAGTRVLVEFDGRQKYAVAKDVWAESCGRTAYARSGGRSCGSPGPTCSTRPQWVGASSKRWPVRRPEAAVTDRAPEGNGRPATDGHHGDRCARRAASGAGVSNR